MQWTNQAIILSATKYGESSGIVTMLTSEHGLCKGLVRGITGKKQCGIYQTGNLVEATWNARLAEHLGNFSSEIIKSNAALILDSKEKLSALVAISSLLEKTLPERDPAPDIFFGMITFLSSLTADVKWIKDYIFLELNLLSHLGFGLDLSSCAATGSYNNLTYISPKSGRAVSQEAGEPYKERLFKIPYFLINGEEKENLEEINNALAICAYFLEKYVFKPHNTQMPVASIRFRETIKHYMMEKETA